MDAIEDKVWEFLGSHGTPVLVITIAKKFRISQSHVGRILKDMIDKGDVEVLHIGNNKWYKAKE